MLNRRAALVLAVPVGLVLVGYVLWPNARALAAGLDAEALRAVFGRADAAGWRGLANSLAVSLGTVAGALVVGTALAGVLWRFRLPFGGWLHGVAALPLALPPLVGVLAFLFLYGESGMLPRTLQAALGLADVPFAFEGRGAVLAVHVYVFYVYVYLFVQSALRGIDGALLDASADMGASGATTFRRVVLPLVRPALVGSGLLVFMLAMGSFTAPLLFAGDTPFLTTQIYGFKTNGYLDRAAAVAAVLTALCLLCFVGTELRAAPTATSGVKGASRPPLPLGGAARVLAGGAVALALLVVLLPVATVVLLSFVEDGTWTTEALPPRYTLANYAALFTDADTFAPIRNSLWMAGAATAANVAFGVAAALLIAKSRLPGRGVLRALALLPFAVPGPVVALALLVEFGGPSVWAGGAVLVGTVALLPLAYFIRHLPLVVRATQAALERFDDRLAEASADLGARGWTTFRRVTWPAVRPAVLAGALLTFVTALGEFVASVLLYVYANRPIGVEVFARLRTYELGTAAAYSVLLMALVAVAVVVSRRLGGGAVER